MATFVLRLQVFTTTTVDEQIDFPAAGTDVHFVGLNLGGFAVPYVTGTVVYVPFGECISLDGAPEISLAAVPLGFKLNGSPLTIRGQASAYGTIIGRLWQRGGISTPADYSRSVSTKGSYTATQDLPGWAGGFLAHAIVSMFLNPDELIDLYTFLQFDLTATDPTLFTTLVFKELEITGPYTIVLFSWSISNGITLPDGSKGYGPEKEFIIESENIFDPVTNPTGTGPCLLVVTAIVFVWLDETLGVQSITVLPADFDDDWSCLNLKFVLPSGLPPDVPVAVHVKSSAFPPILPPEGTGVQFDGTVMLGSITILETLASGLYKIVSGKTDDTVYIDAPNTDDTIEMAIPDPFAKTGFIGG